MFSLDVLCNLDLEESVHLDRYVLALQCFMPCIIARKQWNQAAAVRSLSEFVTPSDEAFMLVNLENQMARWTEMFDKGNTRTSAVCPPFTATMQTHTCKRDEFCQICKKYGGWNEAGIEAFNDYRIKIIEMRKSRGLVEVSWRKIWSEIIEDGRVDKHGQDQHEAMEPVEAQNDLFSEDEEELSVDQVEV